MIIQTPKEITIYIWQWMVETFGMAVTILLPVFIIAIYLYYRTPKNASRISARRFLLPRAHSASRARSNSPSSVTVTRFMLFALLFGMGSLYRSGRYLASLTWLLPTPADHGYFQKAFQN